MNTNLNIEAISEMPSAQLAENAVPFDGAEYTQRVINMVSQEGKTIPSTTSYYNTPDGRSKIYFTANCYAPVAVEVNKLQVNKLINWAFTGIAQQVFPLTEEEIQKAAPEDLEPVQDVRAYALERALNPMLRAGGWIRVYPYADPSKIDLRIKCKFSGAILKFYIDKDSAMADMLRSKNLIF